MDDPKAFSGLWFAAAAGLLVGQALFALPVLVAQARSIGGLAAWQWGTFALAYVYIAPVLVALILGSALGGSIVDPGCADGWAPAARGMLVGVGSLAVWLLIGTTIVQMTPGYSLAAVGEAPPGAAEAVGLILLPVPFLIVAAFGAGAGYLLHALAPRSSDRPSTEEMHTMEVHSSRAA